MRSTTLFKHVRHVWYKEPHYSHEITIAGYCEGEYVYLGVAICSKTDVYNKADGRDYALERLTYNPTFVFPKLHKNPNRATYHWMEIIETINWDDGAAIKHRVCSLQAEFDKTSFGVQLKINRQNKKAEIEAEKKKKKAEHEKKAAEYREKYKKGNM